MLQKGKKKVGKGKAALLGFKGLHRTKDDTKEAWEESRNELGGSMGLRSLY